MWLWRATDRQGRLDPVRAGTYDRSRPGAAMDPTAREIATFEAGVKFGSLYHQFAGTPVSPRSAPALARAIETSIENQPHCRSVTVTVDEEALRPDLDQTYGYAELTGRHLEAEVVVEVEGVEVVARLSTDDGYPLMRVTSIEA